ncbi:MAG: SH3 domain-containing protein [Clostridia bacterium]
MKNKLIALVLTVLVTLTAAAPLALAGTPSSFVNLPSSYGGLNVRSGPGTNYSVAGWVVDGDEIDLIKVGDTWTKVTVLRSGKTGYIKNRFIDDLPGGGDEGDDTQTPSTGGTASTGRVTGSGVNLRKGPSASSGKVTSLSAGTKVRIWETKGNWAYVSTLGGTKGWMSLTYLSDTYTAKTTSRVNMRESANGTVIKKLPAGTTVIVKSVTGSWSKVSSNGTTGYIYNSYLR